MKTYAQLAEQSTVAAANHFASGFDELAINSARLAIACYAKAYVDDGSEVWRQHGEEMEKFVKRLEKEPTK